MLRYFILGIFSILFFSCEEPIAQQYNLNLSTGITPFFEEGTEENSNFNSFLEKYLISEHIRLFKENGDGYCEMVNYISVFSDHRATENYDPFHHELTISNLPKGRYVVSVRKSNTDSFMNESYEGNFIGYQQFEITDQDVNIQINTSSNQSLIKIIDTSQMSIDPTDIQSSARVNFKKGIYQTFECTDVGIRLNTDIDLYSRSYNKDNAYLNVSKNYVLTYTGEVNYIELTYWGGPLVGQVFKSVYLPEDFLLESNKRYIFKLDYEKAFNDEEVIVNIIEED